MKLKIFKKYFLVTTAIIIISLLFMMMILGFFINSYLSDDKKQSLKDTCKTFSKVISEQDFESKKSKDIISMSANGISEATDTQIFLVDSDGVPFFCTCKSYNQDKTCPHINKSVPKNVLKTTYKNNEYFEVGKFGSLFTSNQYIYGSYLTFSESNSNCYIFVYSGAEAITRYLLQIIKMFLMSALVTVLIMFFAVYYVSYRFTKPLKLMAHAARNMAKGDFSERIPISSDDEVMQLASAFNNMADSLVKLESTRRSFIGNISHELKTPMTTIAGFIDGIIDGTIPVEQHNKYLTVVSDEVKRLSRLIQSMLNLSKLESGELKPDFCDFDITSVIIETFLSQEQRIEAKKVNVVGLDNLPECVISGDKDLLHQVIYNLTDNAVKFTNDGGEIKVFSYFDSDNKFNFVIRNTGEGIYKEDLPHIFERFYKVDRSRSAIKDSTGLGLYITKTILDIHKGKITVKSKVNEFTEFQFII